MGTSPSKKGNCLGRRRQSEREEDLKLPGTNLQFTKEQLHRLNLLLIRLQNDIQHDDICRDRAQAAVEVVVERLVQRLVCGAGIIDKRFSSKFLVKLEQGPKFYYLVRLDALSVPPLYAESQQPTCKIVEGYLGGDGIPQGFAKIRVQGEEAEQWVEFVNQYGFLRRDKLQERFVELLAQAAARVSEPSRPDQVDESLYCGSPGKIVDVGILDQILRVPSEKQVFYGPADCNQSRYPDPRDFRIAIVEGAPEVSLRIGFLSPALASAGRSEDVEVKLVLAVGFSGWPQTCDFPLRSSLGHVDCLLYHRAAQTGFYLVPGPPHPTVRCDDRTATWQIWLPAAEMTLLTHHASTSIPGRVLAVAEAAVQQLRGYTTRQMLGGFGLPSSLDQEFLKVTSRYMLQTILWFQLEKNLAGPAAMLLAWTPDKLAAHVLTLLDTLIMALRTQRYRSYFFPWCNIMLHAASSNRHHPEEEYLRDAEIIEKFLRSLHEESSVTALPPDDDAETQKFLTRCKLETALVRKWRDVVCDLAPPATTRSRRLSFSSSSEVGYTTAGAAQYTARQLSYIGHVCREMLRVRQFTFQSSGSLSWLQSPLNSSITTIQQDDPVEDLIYLLTAIIDQAKEQYLGERNDNGTITCRRNKKRSSKVHESSKRQKSDSSTKLKKSYDCALAMLIDAVRRDVDTSSVDLSDDAVLVKYVLQWLYRAMDDDKKTLAPILRPYLNGLFAASHENGWHLEEWRRKNSDEEVESLGIFCQLIIEGKASLIDALTDAAAKGWIWARNVLETAETLRDSSEGPIENTLQLIFTPVQGSLLRHTISLPPRYSVEDVVPRQDFESRSSASSTCKSSYSGGMTSANTMKSRKATLKRASTTLPALITQQTRAHFSPEELTLRLERLSSGSRLAHCRLRDTSPYTLVLDSRRRYGQHRGVGDLVQALVTLHKFSVLQEISCLLPDGERAQMLDAIQKLSKESRRAGAARRAAAKKNARAEQNERNYTSAMYRTKTELQESKCLNANSNSTDDNILEVSNKLKELRIGETLLGTCRATRSQHINGRSLSGSAFFDSPLGRELTLSSPFSALTLNRDTIKNSGISFLQMTEDRQLRLSRQDDSHDLSYNYKAPVVRKKNVVTKL